MGDLASDKFLCRLCSALHDHLAGNAASKSIPDIYEWNAESECNLEPKRSNAKPMRHFLHGRQKAFIVVDRDDVG